MDSSRNLTNIGTISSGAITAAGGGGSSSATLTLNSSTSTTFNHSINALNSNLTAGENNIIIVGKEGSSKNSGYIGYKWNGAGSNSNLLTFGHWASDNLMNLTADGKLGIGTQSPSTKLHVEGSGGTVTSLVECTDGNQASLDIKNSEGHYRIITNGGQLQIYDQTDSRKPFTIDTSGNILLPDDNSQLKFGAGADLQIFHNGTHSYINQSGTGDLFIRNTTDDGDVYIQSDNGSGGITSFLKADGGNGTLQLFHYGSLKASTTSAGISVTGEVNLTGELEINGTDVIDSSRNLVNIGTISSGAITCTGLNSTSGTVQFADGGSSFDSSDGSGYARFSQSNGSAQIGLERTGSSAGVGYIGADSSFLLNVYNSSFSKKASISTNGTINGVSGYQVNGTTVIDSSRNLTNIGTISSTNITSNGSAVVVQSKPLTVVGQPINISAPNSAEMKFLQTTSSTSASKGSIQWFDSGSNSCGTINLKANGSENNSGVMEFYVTAESDELGDDPFGINKMMTITENGVQVHGSLSKSSGSFRIDHPLKPETHDLVHSFVEGPQADNLYRGKIELVDGRAVIDLDEWFGMTPGTFLALNRDLQAFVSNEDDWDAVRAKVMGSQLVIECQNARSKASVSWMVVGERQDNEIYESTLTDDYGKIIVEPEKKVVE